MGRSSADKEGKSAGSGVEVDVYDEIALRRESFCQDEIAYFGDLSL